MYFILKFIVLKHFTKFSSIIFKTDFEEINVDFNLYMAPYLLQNAQLYGNCNSRPGHTLLTYLVKWNWNL